MRRLLSIGIVLLVAAGVVRAEPYIAVQNGLSCSQCHVNRTGGGMRTMFGSGMGRQSMPWKKLSEENGLWDGVLHKRARIGSDLRASYTGNIPDDDPYLGEYVLDYVNLYLDVELLPDRMTFYVDEHVAPGSAASREAFALYRSSKAGMYAKAGRFFLPFGIRFQDDDLFTRRFTGFTFETGDTGIELGAEPTDFSLALAITNGAGGGNEKDNGKQVTFRGAYIRKKGRVGLSAMVNDLDGPNTRRLGGVFGALETGPVVWLAEWDVIQDDLETGNTDSTSAHVELDWQAIGGLLLRGWYGKYDPDQDVSGDDQDQYGAGVDWTPLPGLQLRLWYRFRNGPKDAAGASDDEAVIEAHLYF